MEMNTLYVNKVKFFRRKKKHKQAGQWEYDCNSAKKVKGGLV